MSLGLYIHIPFCKSKCIYCDFLSFAGRCDRSALYVSALLKELETKGRLHRDRVVDTVFIGGGTPTVIPNELLLSVVKSVFENFNVAERYEFTVEANPGTVTREDLKLLRDSGVNRLSMGFQSLDDGVLRFLGRIHDSREAVAAFYDARLAGFNNINIDLIFGMPFDDREAFVKTLSMVKILSPEHISAYSLIIEEGTPLFDKLEKGELCEPDDSFDRDDYSYCKKFLMENGYNHYEISNFAKAGYESRHNSRYWKQLDYIGAGLGAASFVKNRRFSNTDSFELYIDECEKNNGCPSLREDITMSEKELMDEYMMLGFRMTGGPNFNAFERKFCQAPQNVYEDKLKGLIDKGYCEARNWPEGLLLTDKGLDFANEIFEEFV